eukprot:2284409-Pyramimonas_sp.AAC.1
MSNTVQFWGLECPPHVPRGATAHGPAAAASTTTRIERRLRETPRRERRGPPRPQCPSGGRRTSPFRLRRSSL